MAININEKKEDINYTSDQYDDDDVKGCNDDDKESKW